MRSISLNELPLEPVSHNPNISKREMLGSRVAPGLTNFSEAVFSPGQVAAGHRHEDMYEVFFVRRGRGMIVVDGVEQPLSADECVVIVPGEHHEISNPHAEELVLLYFGLASGNKEA
jgi:quercetin dioxygenase-like cupin family protein